MKNYRLPCTLAMAVLLAGCATGPVYKMKGLGDSIGYTDQQLTSNRYRVTFSGGTGTKREDIENYLLRRAAEVTIGAGYAYFSFDTRNVERTTSYFSTFDTWGARPFHGPGYPGLGRHVGYYWAYPPGLSEETIPEARYTAYAEIVMLTPRESANNPNAIAAQEILDRLVPVTMGQAAPKP